MSTKFIGSLERELNVEPLPTSAIFSIAFHVVILLVVIYILVWACILINHTITTPDPPLGWYKRDYDADKIGRLSLTEYVKANAAAIPNTTPMIQFAVATACFGGIFTETRNMYNPWLGNVNPEAARRQVEAGARAILLDVWPDPNTRAPVVCSMEDSQEWGMWWRNNGLDKRVGQYSNWKKLTRNTAPIKSIVSAALGAAFEDGPQKSDPFFLILHLHGAMTKEYLNTLGDIINDILKEQGVNTLATSSYRDDQSSSTPFKTYPYTEFQHKLTIIVVPDIQPGYNILPNINTYAGFSAVFMPTTLGQMTNVLEKTRKTVMFEPSDKLMVSAPNPSCATAGQEATPPTLPETGFCIIRPSTGGKSTDNDDFYKKDSSYTDCLLTGAQFVAVNLFSKNDDDTVLQTFFDNKYFGKYSFVKLK